MISIKSKVVNISDIILPFVVILTSIVVVESSCHTFLHAEFHPFSNKHLAIESIAALLATLFIMLLFLRNRQLSKEVNAEKFELSDVYGGNAFFRLFSESSSDMIHINDLTGTILYVNPVTIDLLGYGQDEIVNKPASDFIHPEDRERIREDMNQLVEGKRTLPREVRLLKNNGQYLDVEIKGFAIKTEGDRKKYIGAVLRDISARKHNEQLLHTQGDWEKTFNTMTDFVSIHDKDFKITKANQALCEFLGKSCEEIVGKLCYQVFHNLDEPYKNCPHKKTSETLQPVTDIINDPNIGVPLQITCSPLFDDGGIFQGSVHVARVLDEAVQQDKNESLIPICAACKSIRISDNSWVPPEDYFIKKLGCEFTHTVCKTCQEKLYPEYVKLI